MEASKEERKKLDSKNIPSHAIVSIAGFVKGAVTAGRTGELQEQRFDQSVAADDARKTCRRWATRVLEIEEFLYANESRMTTQDT